MTKEQLIQRLGITERQYYGIDIIDDYADLSDLISIPEGFNPNLTGNLYLIRLKSIPEGFSPTVHGSLFLNGLTSIPEGFNPTVGGCLFLNGLTSIPEGFNPTVGRCLYLNGLTSIPKGFKPTVGRDLWLNGLTSIPKGFKPTVGWSLFLNGLKAIPVGFNPRVGGQVVSRIEIPFTKISQPIFWEKHILVDDVFQEIVQKKGNVFKVKEIHGSVVSYLVTDGNGKWSHGETLKKAKEDLIYKISNRDTSEYENLNLNSVLSFEKAIECYRKITGSCEFGVKGFMESNNIEQKDYSISEIIELTKNNYGNKEFKEFFS